VESRGGLDPLEQLGLGRAHPNLAAAFEPAEQRRSALGVEMRGDFVQQQERWLAAAIRDQLGMGQDKAQQKRLLLAGRAVGRGHALGAVGDGKVLAVRPFTRSAARLRGSDGVEKRPA
jgi:hypothetical protein